MSGRKNTIKIYKDKYIWEFGSIKEAAGFLEMDAAVLRTELSMANKLMGKRVLSVNGYKVVDYKDVIYIDNKIYDSIADMCKAMGWNTQVFRNTLSKAYKETGKRAVEFRGWRVEKRQFTD